MDENPNSGRIYSWRTIAFWAIFFWFILPFAVAAIFGAYMSHYTQSLRSKTAANAASGAGGAAASASCADLCVLVVRPTADPHFYGVPDSSLTEMDVQAVADHCPSVVAAAPTVAIRDTATFGGRSWVPFHIFGTTDHYLTVRDWRPLDGGRNFTTDEVQKGELVCLIGQTIETELFHGAPAVGSDIMLAKIPVRVIGVLAKRGGDERGFDQDDVLVLPLAAVGGLSDFRAKDSVEEIVVRARSQGQVRDAVHEITDVLRGQHHLTRAQADDFHIVEHETHVVPTKKPVHVD